MVWKGKLEKRYLKVIKCNILSYQVNDKTLVDRTKFQWLYKGGPKNSRKFLKEYCHYKSFSRTFYNPLQRTLLEMRYTCPNASSIPGNVSHLLWHCPEPAGFPQWWQIFSLSIPMLISPSCIEFASRNTLPSSKSPYSLLSMASKNFCVCPRITRLVESSVYFKAMCIAVLLSIRSTVGLDQVKSHSRSIVTSKSRAWTRVLWWWMSALLQHQFMRFNCQYKHSSDVN